MDANKLNQLAKLSRDCRKYAIESRLREAMYQEALKGAYCYETSKDLSATCVEELEAEGFFVVYDANKCQHYRICWE